MRVDNGLIIKAVLSKEKVFISLTIYLHINIKINKPTSRLET